MLLSTVSVLLCILIGFTLPTQVFAQTLPKEESSYSSFGDVVGDTESVGNIVQEIPDGRTENTKTKSRL